MPEVKVIIQAKADAKPGEYILKGYEGRNLFVPNLIIVGILEGGMQSGETSVGFIGELQDGSLVFMETSAAILDGIAQAVKGADQRFQIARGGRG